MADLDGNGSESEDLKNRIDHWLQVIDRWVQDLDQRMGGAAEGADPAEMPGSAPEPAHTTTPAVDTG
ncbi:MAG TPA: hypothetical protein VFH00_10760 [Candidatus Nitrosotalea sp.]|nr:hypothetical protein [Candidatus Nitrosotalea sp.]